MNGMERALKFAERYGDLVSMIASIMFVCTMVAGWHWHINNR